ncbi:hypothetical protein [Seonamhaeicola sp.]|uniref:hypothetical protein n=1 Tax=Seonamhaeicola sp. TaxID=1912245 RepID=UPI003569818F
MEKCEHINIEVITEVPKNDTYPNTNKFIRKKYVICDDCGQRLNINRITSRIIEVDL